MTSQPPDLTTRRLRLRTLTTADARAIAALAGDWDVARMTARVPYPYTMTAVNYWIDDVADGEFVRGIEHDGVLVGVCGYMPVGDGSAEIGYWIGRPWWGRGFATEAVRALMRYCYRQARIRRLLCGHFVDNPASARVIAKLGFRPTGREPLWCEARGQHVDTVRYERRRPFMASLRLKAA